MFFHENAKAKLNNNFQTASANTSNFCKKLSEKTIKCKTFESTKATLESLLSVCQLKIEAQATELVDFKAKKLNPPQKNITISQKKLTKRVMVIP